MAEDLPFASASDVVERGSSFNSVRGRAVRDDGYNERAVVQVGTQVGTDSPALRCCFLVTVH